MSTNQTDQQTDETIYNYRVLICPLVAIKFALCTKRPLYSRWKNIQFGNDSYHWASAPGQAFLQDCKSIWSPSSIPGSLSVDRGGSSLWGSVCCWILPAGCWDNCMRWGHFLCGGRGGCWGWCWRMQPHSQTQSRYQHGLWIDWVQSPEVESKCHRQKQSWKMKIKHTINTNSEKANISLMMKASDTRMDIDNWMVSPLVNPLHNAPLKCTEAFAWKLRKII